MGIYTFFAARNKFGGAGKRFSRSSTAKMCIRDSLGSFDDEPESVAKMDAFLRENGYENDLNDVRLHHEIYLSDPRRVVVEKRKTVIRHPIKKA